LGHPGLGAAPDRGAVGRPEWGRLAVSANGVCKILRRHGISTRAKRPGLITGYRAPYEPPREIAAEMHITTTRPGELVGIDCFFVGRLSDTKGTVWQRTAIDTYSSHPGSVSSAPRRPARTPSNSVSDRLRRCRKWTKRSRSGADGAVDRTAFGSLSLGEADALPTRSGAGHCSRRRSDVDAPESAP
jgi:hypothetical protein